MNHLSNKAISKINAEELMAENGEDGSLAKAAYDYLPVSSKGAKTASVWLRAEYDDGEPTDVYLSIGGEGPYDGYDVDEKALQKEGYIPYVPMSGDYGKIGWKELEGFFDSGTEEEKIEFMKKFMK